MARGSAADDLGSRGSCGWVRRRRAGMRDELEDRPPIERDWGTAAAVTAAVLGGAHIVRVHALTEMMQVVRVAEATRRHGRIADNGLFAS